MPKELNLEMRVGMFVFIAILALVAFVFSISDFSVFQQGTTYTVIFQYANGLKKGAPVRLAGVDSGFVHDLKVTYDRNTHVSRVSIDIWLRYGMVIPIDSAFMINQLGLLGEKYVEIMPGTAKETVKPGSFLAGEDPVPMETVMKKLSAIALKLDNTLTGINDGLLNEANKKAMTDTMTNLAAITAALKEGDGTLGSLLRDKSIYQNLNELTADLKANPWKLFYRPKNSK
jgi:phospholipid/cholesterol/gamma-HCH transport system substrate-binding protein